MLSQEGDVILRNPGSKGDMISERSHCDRIFLLFVKIDLNQRGPGSSY